jgi:hypothetical protein
MVKSCSNCTCSMFASLQVTDGRVMRTVSTHWRLQRQNHSASGALFRGPTLIQDDQELPAIYLYRRSWTLCESYGQELEQCHPLQKYLWMPPHQWLQEYVHVILYMPLQPFLDLRTASSPCYPIKLSQNSDARAFLLGLHH